ncbi:hypothetical protein [Haloferax sp. ATB1]|uniref:hypothetical protein n=1 Tax=Haloferax sp. ATB1 TaxID=1508454 RepID=UPI0005B2201E|nr:hypothetical protein [Haloferax sp. ATB1]
MPNAGVTIIGLNRLRHRFDDLRETWGGTHSWVVGSSGVEYAVYLETGTKDMPAYPWFRPAVIHVMRAQADDIADSVDSIDELVEELAKAMMNQMKKNVNAGEAEDRSPGTDDEHPKVQLGNLRASITARRIR